MLGYISSSTYNYYTLDADFPVAVKWVCTVSKGIAIPLTQKEESTV